MTGYASQALRKAAKEAAVRFYAPGTGHYFDEESRAETRVVAKARPRAQRSQTTLEAFT